MGRLPRVPRLTPRHVKAPARVFRSRHPRRARRDRRFRHVADRDGHCLIGAAAGPVVYLNSHIVGAVLLVPAIQTRVGDAASCLGVQGRSRPNLAGRGDDGEQARVWAFQFGSQGSRNGVGCIHRSIDVPAGQRVLSHSPCECLTLVVSERRHCFDALVGLQT